MIYEYGHLLENIAKCDIYFMVAVYKWETSPYPSNSHRNIFISLECCEKKLLDNVHETLSSNSLNRKIVMCVS